MKLLLLAPKKKSPTTNLIIDESKKLFKKVDHVPIKDIAIEAGDKYELRYKKKNLSDYDYLLPRIDSRRAEFGYKVMGYFDLRDIKKPYKANTIMIAHNKFTTLYHMKKEGLPVPKTWLAGSKGVAEKIIKDLNFPIVIKLVSSFGGRGITFAETYETAKSIIDALENMQQEVLIEEFIETNGEDIRIMVVGDETIAMKRIAKKGEKKANIHAGGKGVSYNPTDEENEIALKAAKAIGAKICAIDIMTDKNGPKVIEANINPGITGLTKASGENVAKIISTYIYRKAKE